MTQTQTHTNPDMTVELALLGGILGLGMGTSVATETAILIAVAMATAGWLIGAALYIATY